MSGLDCIRCLFTRKDLPERDIYRIVEQGNGTCKIQVRYYMPLNSLLWCKHSCEWDDVYGNYASRDMAIQAIKAKIALVEGDKIVETYTEEDLGL